MSRHMCVVSRNQPLISTNTFQTVSIYGKPPTIAEMKETMTTACVNMCCQDLRSFDTISGKGFLDLVQKVSWLTPSMVIFQSTAMDYTKIN